MKKQPILVCTLLCCGFLSAQGNFLSIGQEISISSQILGGERKVAVYLPDNYAVSTEKYPVLYLLDAEWNFHYLTGLVRQLVSSADIPELIVVGLINADRNRDLTPASPNEPPGSRFGGANNFLQFIVNELEPTLARRYRFQPYRILAGHSFGGLFAIFSMIREPGFFQACVALGPSLGRNDEQQLKAAEAFIRKRGRPNQSLFVAAGNEGGYTFLSSKKLARILEKAPGQSLRWTLEHWPEESHVSITIPGFRKGLQFVFEGFNVEKMQELDDFPLVQEQYRSLSRRLGFEIKVPEKQYEKYISRLIAERDLDYAFFILAGFKEQYPGSVRMMRLYADAHLLKGEFEKAKPYYLSLMKHMPDHEDLRRLMDKLK